MKLECSRRRVACPNCALSMPYEEKEVCLKHLTLFCKPVKCLQYLQYLYCQQSTDNFNSSRLFVFFLYSPGRVSLSIFSFYSRIPYLQGFDKEGFSYSLEYLDLYSVFYAFYSLSERV